MRLIDVDALLKDAPSNDYLGMFIIKSAPIIEAKPIIHAHWIRNGLNDDFYCSNCNNIYIIRQTGRLPKFCGECGAKMDEEDKQ